MYLNITRTDGDTDEHVICANRCFLYMVVPEGLTTGTITLRDAAETGGSNVIHVCAAGLGQTGKIFGGAQFHSGLTVQLSAGTDLSAIIWEAE